MVVVSNGRNRLGLFQGRLGLMDFYQLILTIN